MLNIGDKAPDFSVKDDQGNEVSLAGLKGKKAVIYFYPKDDTPGCTKEACGFRDEYSAFTKNGVEIFGISPDSEASHKKFIGKFDLPFRLLVDADHKIAESFGAWGEKKMYGKSYMGIIRSTFVIDEAGKVIAAFPKVKVDNHINEVKEALGI